MERTECPYVVKMLWGCELITTGQNRWWQIVADFAQKQTGGRGERDMQIKTKVRGINENEHRGKVAERKGKDENEEPSDKVTDGNTHSFTASLYHSTADPSEIPPLVKQITAVDEYQR